MFYRPINRIITLYTSLLATWMASFTVVAEEVTIAVFNEHERYVAAARNYGLSWKILELAAENQQLQLIPQEGSWRASMNRLKAGKVDLVYSAVKTEERNTWAIFSAPLVATGSAIFTQPENTINSIEQIDFSSATVGVSANSVQEKFAKEVGFQNIYTTVERSQLYEMLRLNRLDYLFFGIGVVDYYCTYYDPIKRIDCLKQVGKPYNTNTVHLMGDDTPRLRNIIEKINKGFVNVSTGDKVKSLFEQYNQPPEKYQQWKSLLTH